jgi:hypothetical protein
MAPDPGTGEQDSGDGNREKVLVMVWQNHMSAAHDGERSADDQQWHLDHHLG